MTDRAWPRPARPNPLLPHALQAAQQMPFATPTDSLARCQRLTTELIDRVPELVFSYPAIENDYAAAPSPVLRGIAALDSASLCRPWTGYFQAHRDPLLEDIQDDPPPLVGNTLPGGASTLALQARCPLRAFIESRLLARPVEEVRRGIDARVRGIVTHRALELLLGSVRGRSELAALDPGELDRRLMDCTRRALHERLGKAAAALRSYWRLERDRLTKLLRLLIAVDLKRGDFQIVGLEVKQTAVVSGLDVGARIDRIDRLADGRLAIIDYKTGQRASPSDWLKPRLLEPQLPLYLGIATADAGAVMFCSLQSKAVTYKGFSDTAEAFPGRTQRLPPGVDWSAQRLRWSEQLTQLVSEFAAGDGRIFVDEYSLAAGAHAPLTRVYSQLLAFREDIAVEPV